jgi:hypothetical protein
LRDFIKIFTRNPTRGLVSLFGGIWRDLANNLLGKNYTTLGFLQMGQNYRRVDK